jgi:hypothetical protein
MPLNLRNTMPTGDAGEFVGSFETWAGDAGLDLTPASEEEAGRYTDEDTARAYSVWLESLGRADA